MPPIRTCACLDADAAFVDPNVSDVDTCIRSGRGDWPGVIAEKLADQPVFPVCAPALAERLSVPADLGGVPVLRDRGGSGDWNVWLAAQGLAAEVLGDGSTFSDAGLCMDAAIAGQGVFLGWATLVEDALANGILVEPFRRRVETGSTYWSVTGRIDPPRRAVRDFDH